MAKVSPSILSANFAALGPACTQVLEAGADWLHFDVMDGHFVPNISFGVPVLKSLHKALPDAYYDVHLMISRPQDYVKPFAAAGASLICFHAESECDIASTIDAIHAAGCAAGVAIKPATAPETIYPYLDKLELVLVMSVEPGFGGQKFMHSAEPKMAALRAERERRGLHYLIEVDGGIDDTTGPLCTAAGADVLVAGSAIFGKEDPAAAVKRLAAM